MDKDPKCALDSKRSTPLEKKGMEGKHHFESYMIWKNLLLGPIVEGIASLFSSHSGLMLGWRYEVIWEDSTVRSQCNMHSSVGSSCVCPLESFRMTWITKLHPSSMEPPHTLWQVLLSPPAQNTFPDPSPASLSPASSSVVADSPSLPCDLQQPCLWLELFLFSH